MVVCSDLVIMMRFDDVLIGFVLMVMMCGVYGVGCLCFSVSLLMDVNICSGFVILSSCVWGNVRIRIECGVVVGMVIG